MKNLFKSGLWLAAITYGATASGQIGPEQLISRPYVRYPSIMATEDLDGDGIEDLIVSGSSNIVWYRNSGLESFDEMDTIAPVGYGVTEVRTGDIDGDGDMDLLCSYTNSNCAYDVGFIQENPLFLVGMIPPAPPPPAQGYVSWFENINNGSSWVEHLVDDTLAWAYTVDMGDLDGDGDVDFVAGTSQQYQCTDIEGSATWYENLGSGVFGGRQYLAPLSDSLNVYSIRVSDLDGDNDLDIIAAKDQDNLLVLFENLGGAQFTQYSVDSLILFNPRRLEFADIDSDGSDELVVATYDQIGWMDTTGTAMANPFNIIEDSLVNLHTLHVRDADGDGDLDVLSGSSYDQRTILYENSGLGSSWNEVIVDSVPGSVIQVHSIDMNNDGYRDHLDLLRLSSFREITWRKNVSGQFQEKKWVTPDFTSPTSVFSADMDSDDDMDILVSSYFDNKITLYENLGGGAFTDPQILSDAVDGAYCIHISDVDIDGKPDIVCAASESHKVFWLRNLGAGVYSDTILISNTATTVRSVVAEDLSGDGFPDVVAACRYGDKVTYYENTGAGTFASEVILADSIDQPIGLAVGDVDGDLDSDILVTVYDDGQLLFIENLGSGLFATEVVLSSSFYQPILTEIVDVDVDGDFDVLCSDAGGLNWFENLNNTGFAPEILLYEERPVNLTSGDLTGNGTPELIASFSSYPDHYGSFVLMDDATLAFDSLEMFGSINGQHFLSDLDLDGDKDIVAIRYPHKLVWYENLYLLTDEEETEITPIDVTIYPNPTTGRCVIRNHEKAQLTVTDAKGRVVLTKSCNVLTQIDLSDQPDGLYLLKFEGASGITNKKLMKMN